MDCDSCSEPALWYVYAAYDIPTPTAPHPTMARYPGAMFRVCNDHLTVLMAQDSQTDGTTKQWVVKPASNNVFDDRKENA